MKEKVIAILASVLMSLNAFPQNWESIRDSEDYVYAVGSGSSIEEADKHALANLISQIVSHVLSESKYAIKSSNANGQLDESSQFTQSAITYSQATLINSVQKVLRDEPNALVARWIKKTEIAKIFESRKRKAIDLVDDAIAAEDKGNADIVLRNFYWALALLKSLQYPNEVTYTDKEGKLHVLTNWIKQRLDETFDDLKAEVVKREGDDVRLYITYKGKPVNSVSFTYFDGRSWSNIYSAWNGIGQLELPEDYAGRQIQLKYEYEFSGEAKIDSELEAVLTMVSGTPMRRATTYIVLEEASKSAVKTMNKAIHTESFSKTDALTLAPPKTAPKKDVVEHSADIERIVKAIGRKDYQSITDCFSTEGWNMFTKLMKYGKAKVLDSSDISFYNKDDIVLVRGLKMSFSFESNVRKRFVEDVNMVFDKDGKICNIAFGLGKTAEDDILNKGVWDEKSRFAIMSFLENYKTAYALKRLDYIRSVFDDDAIIITGTVIRKANHNAKEKLPYISSTGNQIIKRNRQTKDQYIKNLERCFARNEYVNIRFSNNDVIKLGEGGELYGIQIAQDYYSSTYGDKGYLFLMVDINDSQKPLIKVRTWQPEKDPNIGLYGPGNF